MATVDNTGLVAHWKMDEIVGGQVVDETGNYPLTVSTGMTQAANITDGRFNKSIFIDNGQNLTVTMPALSTWSIVGWVKLLDADEYAHIFSVKNNQGAFALKMLYGDRRLYFYKQSTGSKITNVALPLNEWAHFAATYDGSTLRFYVNTVEGTAFAGSGFGMPAEDYVIGANYVSTTEDIRWLHDQRRIYSRAITAQEVLDHYNEDSPFVVAGTVRENGVPQQRTVRLYDNATGELIEEQTTSLSGEYQFSIFQDKEMYVVALPEAGRRPKVHGPVMVSER